jgi:glycyl-tRNA synthetase
MPPLFSEFPMADSSVMEKLVSLCKRRGFIYPASEIYGGLNGFWDYGPLGVLLKNNIRDWWWRNMVITPPIGPDGHPVDIVGLDSSIIQHPKTWVASGHAAGFTDPMVDCRETQARYRADKLVVWELHPVGADPQLVVTNDDAGDVLAAVREGTAKKLVSKTALRIFEKFAQSGGGSNIRNFMELTAEQRATAVGPDATKGGTLTEPRSFNLMLGSEVGAVDPVKVHLRPETAQGIFLNYKNILDTTRVKIPFGVAQVGKSFRNEVTPRNYIFRSREFEQMEMEWFCHADDARKWYDFWKQQRMDWWRSLGVADANLRFRDHAPDELSFYSKMTVDIEYKYPFTAPDFGELEGIAHRGEYDLTQHSTHSGQKLDYFDQDLQLKLKEQGVSPEEVKARSRYIPNVIEPASGLTRAVLVVLCEAYRHEAGRQGTEEMLSIKPQFAPIKCGIFPLVQKEGMPETAEKLYLDLRQHFTCEYDAKQSIGRRYARMDEIGTPFCVTVDGQTAQDQSVTIRSRDSMQQQRIGLDKVLNYLREQLGAGCS